MHHSLILIKFKLYKAPHETQLYINILKLVIEMISKKMWTIIISITILNKGKQKNRNKLIINTTCIFR